MLWPQWYGSRKGDARKNSMPFECRSLQPRREATLWLNARGIEVLRCCAFRAFLVSKRFFC